MRTAKNVGALILALFWIGVLAVCLGFYVHVLVWAFWIGWDT